jgi:hypothetical protein
MGVRGIRPTLSMSLRNERATNVIGRQSSGKAKPFKLALGVALSPVV